MVPLWCRLNTLAHFLAAVWAGTRCLGRVALARTPRRAGSKRPVYAYHYGVASVHRRARFALVYARYFLWRSTLRGSIPRLALFWLIFFMGHRRSFYGSVRHQAVVQLSLSVEFWRRLRLRRGRRG